MYEFYGENFIAVFLGDGKESRRRARELYSKHCIISCIFDRRITFLSKLTPRIKCFCIDGMRYDDTVLMYIETIIEKERYKTPILFWDKQKFGGFVARNREYLDTFFMLEDIKETL